MRQLNSSSMRARAVPAPAFRVSRQVAGFICRGFRELPSRAVRVRALRSGGPNLEGAGNAAKCRPPSAVAAEAVRVRWTEKSALKTQDNASISEQQIEKVIYGCRFFTLLGVSGSLIGAILCFIKHSAAWISQTHNQDTINSSGSEAVLRPVYLGNPRFRSKKKSSRD